jgi:alpha-glucosidase
MGFTGSDIGGFAEQPSEWFMRGGFNGCFILLSDHTLPGIMEIRSHGHLMKTVLLLLENLLTYGISCYHIYIFLAIYWREFPMLKPLVYDQSDIQTHYRNDRFILETKF